MPIISNITPLPMTTTETNVDGGPLPYQVLGDRYEYWTNDEFGLFYVKMEIPEFPEQITTILLRDEDTNTTIATLAAPYEETTDRFSFMVDIDALPYGNYIIEILLLNYLHESSGTVEFGGTYDRLRVLANAEPEAPEVFSSNYVYCNVNTLKCDEVCRTGVVYNGAIIPAITVCNETETVANLLKADNVFITVE